MAYFRNPRRGGASSLRAKPRVLGARPQLATTGANSLPGGVRVLVPAWLPSVCARDYPHLASARATFPYRPLPPSHRPGAH